MAMVESDCILVKVPVQFASWGDYPTPQAIVTSPPYWGKRAYDVADTWFGGSPDCKHKVVHATLPAPTKRQQPGEAAMQSKRIRRQGAYAGKPGSCYCGAWFGQLGQEHTPHQFIKHLADIFDQLPLADDGVAWINLGDTYVRDDVDEFKTKDLAMIPERFAIELHKRGWYIRSQIIWSKVDALPEPVKDRPVSKYEKIIMATRARRYRYYADAVVEPVKFESRAIRYAADKVGKYSDGNDAGQSLNHPRPRTKYCPESDLFGGVDGVRFADADGKAVRNVWELNTAHSLKSHLAPMPDALAARAILLSTQPGDYVLDPFAGTGTTARAAAKLGRKSISVDMDDNFYDYTKDIPNIQSILV